MKDSLNKVKKKVTEAFKKRQASIYEIARFYAAEAWVYFLNNQATQQKGTWWDNSTYNTALKVFTRAFIRGKSIGWFIAHGSEHGVELTLSDNREHDALTPILNKFAPMFLEATEKLYKG